MTAWQPYTALADQHTVVGDLRVYKSLYSPQLQNHRDVLVWLPPSYGQSDKHYPVIYMHDGQNLFDKYASFVGEWQVDETMQALSGEGLEAIIVGLPNNENRMYEYNPYSYHLDGRGELYLQFLVEIVRPLVDSEFRTLKEPAFTGIAGSSMGGLISLYGFLMYPAVFGFCGAFSTAYWFGQEGLLNTIDEKADGRGKIYLDVGGKEGYVLDKWQIAAGNTDHAYVEGVQRLRDALIQHGYQPGTSLLYVEESDGAHHENDWARRLPAALRYLLTFGE